MITFKKCDEFCEWDRSKSARERAFNTVKRGIKPKFLNKLNRRKSKPKGKTTENVITLKVIKPTQIEDDDIDTQNLKPLDQIKTDLTLGTRQFEKAELPSKYFEEHINQTKKRIKNFLSMAEEQEGQAYSIHIAPSPKIGLHTCRSSLQQFMEDEEDEQELIYKLASGIANKFRDA